MPWTWERWPDYVAALEGRPTSVHAGGYVGHLALRTYVMGPAAWERAATPDEVQRMCAVLDEGLAVGALGLSLNFFDKDRTLRLVPGFFADDDELLALFRVVARHRPATVQCITRFNDREHDVADAERMARLLKAAGGVRGQWPGIPMNVRDADHRPALWDAHHRIQADGADLWPAVAFKPLAPFFSFERSIVFQRVPAWNEWVNGPAETKLATLADPAWRDRARTDWDNRTRSSLSRIDRPDEMILTESETGAGPVGISLADVRRPSGGCTSPTRWPSGCSPTASASLMVGVPEQLDEGDIVRALREPRTLPNINDSGAHQQLFAAAGEHVYLLSHYVRDAGLISVEEAVHCLTGRPAGFFGLHDRGVIAPGKVGRPGGVRARRDRARARDPARRRPLRHVAPRAGARRLPGHHRRRRADLARRRLHRRPARPLAAPHRRLTLGRPFRRRPREQRPPATIPATAPLRPLTSSRADATHPRAIWCGEPTGAGDHPGHDEEPREQVERGSTRSCTAGTRRSCPAPSGPG